MTSPAPVRRITITMLAVLKVLMRDDDPHRHGYAIAREIKKSTATVYPILARLERAGWVTSAWESREDPAEPKDTGAARKYYRLTDLGRSRAEAAIRERQEKMAKLVEWARQVDAPGGAE